VIPLVWGKILYGLVRLADKGGGLVICNDNDFGAAM
jgi:hypothetical protein